MKKLTLSIAAVMAMGTFAVAGGDIAPVEPVIVEEVAPVADDSGFYAGLGYTYVNLNGENPYGENNHYEFDISTSMTTFLAGYQINKYIAVEGRYVPQFVSLENSENDNLEIDISNLALYAKGMYPIGDFSLYALVGYGQTSLEITAGDSEEVSESGFQWGLGAAYALSEHTSLFVDYTRLYDDKGFDDVNFAREFNPDTDYVIDAFTFGMTYKF